MWVHTLDEVPLFAVIILFQCISQQYKLMQIQEVPTFQFDQILTTNFLVLFRGIKQIREVLRLHFHNTWVE